MVCGRLRTTGAYSGSCTCPNGTKYDIGVKHGKTCWSSDKYACEGGAEGPCSNFYLSPGVGKKVTCGVEYGWGGKCTCPDGTVFDSGVRKYRNCAAGASYGCQNGTASDCKEEIGVWSGTKVVCGYEHGTWGGDCKCPDGQTHKVGDNGDQCGSLQCVGGEKKNCNQRVDILWKHKKVTCSDISPKFCTECWDKDDIKKSNWPAKKTYTAAKLVGVNA